MRKRKRIEVDTLQVRDEPDIHTLKELEEVEINSYFPEQNIKIGKQLTRDERDCLVEFLKENLDVFAWQPEDMRGIDKNGAMHCLNADLNIKPFKQKVRHLSPNKEKAVLDEVEKLLKAGIIEKIQYPIWLACPVMVLKENKKWRMCIDFTDMNTACPKDCYPLPKIDMLVDSIAGHKVFNFIDAYSGYHQIKMAEEDREKMAFRMPKRNFCYKMMGFGLKNVGATYQRMVNEVFKSQIGRNIEAYIDNMVIKTKEGDHLGELAETFDNLRKNSMKLNPSKCTFGVIVGIFLGYR